MYQAIFLTCKKWWIADLKDSNISRFFVSWRTLNTVHEMNIKTFNGSFLTNVCDKKFKTSLVYNKMLKRRSQTSMMNRFVRLFIKIHKCTKLPQNSLK